MAALPVSATVRRPLALLLAALLLAAALAAGFAVAAANREAAGRAEQVQRAVFAERALLARREPLAAEVAALRRAGQLTDLFLPADSQARAAAALQDLVKQAAGKAGAGLDSIETLEGQALEGVRTVAVRVRMTASLDSLQATLHALEMGRPLVAVDGLFVHARTTPPERQVRNLDVRFDAVGYVPGGAS